MRSDEQRREDLLARIGSYHGIGLGRVLEEIAYLRDDGDSVIAGGSLAYGFGNHLSDLDLLVGGAPISHSASVPLEHFLGSLRVDVWKFSQEVIEETFDRAETVLYGDRPLLGTFGDLYHEDELKLLHRIAYGVLLDGEPLRQQRERDYGAVASGLVVREYAERMRGSCLSAQLALRADRPVAAVVSARLAVEEALNAIIVHRGFPFSGDKWLRERLASEATDLAEAYAAFGQLPADPAAEAGSFVAAALELCGAHWGLDLELDSLLAEARWRNTDLQLMRLGPERLLLSAAAGVLWALEDAEARSWEALAELGAAEAEGLWAMTDCDAEGVVLCLRLHEHGVLKIDWPRGVALADLSPGPGVEVPA